MNMRKYISVPNEIKVELRQMFKCTKETVWKALNYETDSNLAKLIRKVAKERGGVEFDPSKQKITNLNS